MKPKRPSDYPWPVTAHHASFIEDFTNAMDSRPITPTTASDSAMTTPPTATPRTNDGLLAVALACEHCTESVHLYGTDMKKHGADIRRVLAELAAERERVRVLRSHGVEALMVARSWQMVWGDKLSPESVAIFTKHEQAFLAALAATKEGAK